MGSSVSEELADSVFRIPTLKMNSVGSPKTLVPNVPNCMAFHDRRVASLKMGGSKFQETFIPIYQITVSHLRRPYS
jgi:hypothetical protein